MKLVGQFATRMHGEVDGALHCGRSKNFKIAHISIGVTQIDIARVWY